ncbi:hypothetical protein ACFSCZ_11250 [Siminovitchia sediminis]|uniref:Uncharacterized protein n=1 Tax=Siminovitchia sediminis TaxID=1274353 RepID=A0ABW4KJS1_9BACI
MEMSDDSKRSMNPVIHKCMKHLDVIGVDDKTKQIVYMYMKTLEDELKKEIELNH